MAEGDAVTLIERLRVVAASLRDFDHAPDNIEVDAPGVSALIAEASTALAESERARETLRRERNAALNERDEARAEIARLLRLASGPHINDEVTP